MEQRAFHDRAVRRLVVRDLLALVGWLCVIAGAMAAGNWYERSYNRHVDHLYEYGVTVRGVIVSTDSETDPDIGAGTPTTVYSITVRYVVDGTQYDREVTVTDLDGFEVGQPIDVLADRTEPRLVEVAGYIEVPGDPVWIAFVAGVLVLGSSAHIVHRAFRWVRMAPILAAHAWRPATMVVIDRTAVMDVGDGRPARMRQVLVDLDVGGTKPTRLYLGWCPRFGWKHRHVPAPGAVEYAGELRRRVVLRSPGGSSMIMAKRHGSVWATSIPHTEDIVLTAAVD